MADNYKGFWRSDALPLGLMLLMLLIVLATAIISDR
jgi:hypothetical protein